MVGKKIINNIPSLSSLLLAGVVLGSNCFNKSGGKSLVQAQEEQSQGAKLAAKFGIADAKKWNAIEKMMQAAFGAKKEGALKHYEQDPGVLTIPMSLKAKDLKGALENACKSFGSDVYPKDVRDALNLFKDLAFATGGEKYSTKTLVSNKSLWRDMLNPIITARYKFGCFYTELQQILSNYSYSFEDKVDKISSIKDALTKDYNEITKRGDKNIFEKSFSWSYATKDKLKLNKKKELHFSEGKDFLKLLAKLPNNTKNSEVRSTLDKRIEHLWLNLIVPATPPTTPSTTSSATPSVNAPVNVPVNVSQTACECLKNPNIPPIRGFGMEGQGFKIHGSSDKRFDFGFPVLATSKGGVTTCSLALKQLLFSVLFHGTTQKDLFKFSVKGASDSDMDVKFELPRYLKLIAMAKEADLNKLADHIGHHIQIVPELQRLFPIFDMQDVEDKVFTPEVYSKRGCAPNGDANDNSKLGDDSLTVLIFDNLFKYVDSNATSVSKMTIKELNQACDNAKNMNVNGKSYAERVVGAIIEEIMKSESGNKIEDSSIFMNFDSPSVGERVIARVSAAIGKVAAKHFLVKKEKGGSFTKTDRLKDFADHLKAFDGAMRNYQQVVDSLSYEEIPKYLVDKKICSKSQVENFNIDKVKTWIDGDYAELTWLATLPEKLSSILDSNEEVLEFLDLLKSNDDQENDKIRQRFNLIRGAYRVEKNEEKKASAPDPAPAA